MTMFSIIFTLTILNASGEKKKISFGEKKNLLVKAVVKKEIGQC